jgi:hypothetical protein
MPANYKPDYHPAHFDSKKYFDPDVALRSRIEMSDFEKKRLEMAQNFWNNPIDLGSPLLNINSSPFVLQEEAPFSKIHFLFTMLNINMLFIVKQGVMTGLITKLEFIKKRKLTSAVDSKISHGKLELLKNENILPPSREDYEKFFFKL